MSYVLLEEVGKRSAKWGGVDEGFGRIVTGESLGDGSGRQGLFLYEERGGKLCRRDLWEEGYGGVGSKLYGYGGRSFCVWDGGEVWIEDGTQALWLRREGLGLECLWSCGEEGFRLGALSLCGDGGGWRGVVGVWEREREGKSGLLYVDGEGGVFEYDVETDFVTSPQVSSDGRRLVWLGWNDPYMPWDRNSVWIADREEGGGWVGMRELLAEEEESCYFLPRWDGEGHLYVMKETGEDEGGYWNLHRVYEEEGAVEGAVENVLPLQAECGLPQWQSGMSTYDFCGKDEVVVAYTHGGRWHLGRGDLQKGEVVETCEGEWSAFEGIVCGDGFVVFLGVHVNGDREVVKMATRGMRVESRSMDVRGEREEVWYDVFSVGEEEEKGVMVYYPPRGFSEGDEAPPVIVRVHGGPTAQVVGEADVRTAYWTSRGVGVCDVNYRGSSGFGRSYRRKLEGGWGCVEVEDIRSAARRLVEKGYGDGERMVVYGTSAGGLSVLMSLIEGDEFCGGICLYGVTDLRDLLTSTHRFEAYYVESLVGKREDEEKYRSRSPLYRGGEVRKPVLFFHGREDMVVPCSQTEEMVGVIRAKGGDAELVIFEGEGHGFRKRETVMACMEAQEKFLRRVFGYEGETWA